ncbi:TPA: DUF1259 domain-containing protein [Legionella pneumophila]|nr:DUF1259 domain-containing protein [Legionella pneumophila]HBD7173651.1 DUF1259 domain-containing protein [Legionella pneumophila]HCU5989935.1 DUF1259 domain-containing protein [Legionella pneumophila]HDP7979104.1 DUF1259 domain-containing protein [Legionella pneumophila]HEM6948547.1 DUF1259 domain-containing protein [Legionella pneumophila]
MNSHLRYWLKIALASTSIFLCTITAYSQTDQLDIKNIEKLTGLKGKLNEKENVFKVSYPRKDLSVRIKEVKVTPAMGLTAWASFTKSSGKSMVMGDIVMTEDQVNRVMDVALSSGLEVTALHNHFFWDEPKIMFMHIGGMGNEETLAQAVGKVFSELKAPAQSEKSGEAIDPVKSKLKSKELDNIIGHKSELSDGVLKYTIEKKTKMHGHVMGSAMGVNTWAAFAGTDKNAVVDGDFAMFESELQGVLKALRKADIKIVAIHNHMTMEEPRIIFLHYWGRGSAEHLARGLRSALDTQK